MRKYILILLTASFFSCKSGQYLSNDLEQANLRGPVKMVQKEHFKDLHYTIYNEKGRTISKSISFSPKDTIEHVYHYQGNKKSFKTYPGREQSPISIIIEQDGYHEEVKLNHLGLFQERKVQTTDSLGNTFTVHYIRSDKKEAGENLFFDKEYNAMMHIDTIQIDSIFYDTEHASQKKFNYQKLIKDSSLWSLTSYSHLDIPKRTKTTYTLEQGDTLGFTREQWDKKDRSISLYSRTYIQNDSIPYTWELTKKKYNRHHDIVKLVLQTYRRDTYINKSKFKYDRYGNWITDKQNNTSGIADSNHKLKRIIKYYAQ